MDTALKTRLTAQQILLAIETKNQPLYAILDDMLNKYTFDERDRAFIKQLVLIVLKRKTALNKLIDTMTDKKLTPKEATARTLLQIGLAQIFFMDVQDFAAVNTCVELFSKSREGGVRAKKGMANAILRRATREKETRTADLQKNAADNLPSWLADRWSKNYGERTSREIAEGILNDAPLDLTFKTLALRDKYRPIFEAQPLGETTLRLVSKGRIEALDGFDKGDWWVQDFAASIPAALFPPLKGKRIADLCAAPGGKTMQLAALGGDVTAVERSKERIRRLEENLKRTKLSATILQTDVMAWKPEAKFDAILLDAPCTATGTLRRSPDVAYLKTVADIEKLAQIQTKMLAHAFSMLKEGGTLVYCTCSLEPEEGEKQAQVLIDTHKSAQRVPIGADEIDGISEGMITGYGDLRTLPSFLSEAGGMDGFFAARFTKRLTDK